MNFNLIWWTGLLKDVIVVGVVQVAPDADELRREVVVLEASAGHSQVVKFRQDFAIQMTQLKIIKNSCWKERKIDGAKCKKKSNGTLIFINFNKFTSISC